jgi:hypothetical protein
VGNILGPFSPIKRDGAIDIGFVDELSGGSWTLAIQIDDNYGETPS